MNTEPSGELAERLEAGLIFLPHHVGGNELRGALQEAIRRLRAAHEPCEQRIVPCKECEFPTISARSGSVNGGFVNFGCARCSHRKLQALRQELKDLHSGDAVPDWANNDMPSMEEVKARGAELNAKAAKPPVAEPHVIKQIEHALDDCRDQIKKDVADYIRGCILDYRHSLTK